MQVLVNFLEGEVGRKQKRDVELRKERQQLSA